MVRTVCVVGVTLLAACILSGCASSGSLKAVEAQTAELDARLNTVQETMKTVSDGLKKMETTLQNATKKLDEQVTAQNTKLAGISDSVKAALGDVKKLDADLAALRKDTDTRFQASAKRAGKTETDIASAGQQIAAFKADIARFDSQFKQIGSAVGQAQKLILKNLENARDIYKTQFLALDELLQKLNKPQKAPEKDEKPPAPK